MRWLDIIVDSMDMSLSKLRVGDGPGSLVCCSPWGQESRTQLSNFNFSISPSNEYSGFVSFKIEWFDLLAVRWTLKSLLQHHQFFSTQPSLWSNSYVHTQLLEKP